MDRDKKTLIVVLCCATIVTSVAVSLLYVFDFYSGIGSSMLPTIAEGSLCVGLQIFDHAAVVNGSIIRWHYNPNDSDYVVPLGEYSELDMSLPIYFVHRVINTGVDDKGLYYITKGDNNNYSDPVKIRPSDIRSIVIFIVP